MCRLLDLVFGSVLVGRFVWCFCYWWGNSFLFWGWFGLEILCCLIILCFWSLVRGWWFLFCVFCWWEFVWFCWVGVVMLEVDWGCGFVYLESFLWCVWNVGWWWFYLVWLWWFWKRDSWWRLVWLVSGCCELGYLVFWLLV